MLIDILIALIYMYKQLAQIIYVKCFFLEYIFFESALFLLFHLENDEV